MSLGETSSRRRWLRTAVLAIAGGLLVTTFVIDTMQIVANGDIGIDAEFYRSVGRRFLDEGTYYLPHQLSGPYDVQLQSDVIYPPSALFLFVPYAVAPWWLWWVVPIAITGYVIWRWRPAWWGVAAMLTLLCWPRAHAAFPYGNTDMWAMAGVAAALMWGWPSIFLTLKPTFAPLAVIGITQRRWWLALAVLLIVSVPMAELWREYLGAMGNLRIGSDYALGSLPLLAVPVVAWVSRTRRDRGMEWRVPAALDTRIRGRHRIGVDSGTPVDPRQNPEHDFRVVDNPDAMRRDFEPSSIESEET